jgi:hypothetical protein
MNITSINGSITVNGKQYKGQSVIVRNGELIIDGVSVDKVGDPKIEVHIHGNCEKVTLETGDIKVTGNVSGNVTTQVGDITCGDVGGNASSENGDIKCKNIKGDAHTENGDIVKRMF